MKHIFSSILVFLLCLYCFNTSEAVPAPTSPPAVASQIRGIQSPQKIVQYARQDLPSSSADHPTVQRCNIFPTFIAIEIDSGQVGIDQLTVRRRAKTANVEDICKPKDYPGEISLPDEEQYVLGTVGNFLITRSADSSGEERILWIYDVMNGKRLYEARYQEHQDFLVTPGTDTLSLEYFGGLSLTCDLLQRKPDCWEKTLQENKVPASANLQRPDCRAIYQSKDFKENPALVHEPRAIQISAKIRVPDVRKTAVIYPGGPVLCNAAP